MKKACPLSRCDAPFRRPGVALLAVLAAAALVPCAGAQSVNITSSPNVVGSGARALGMGGAFVAVADDATAASWNPGGLTQLERPEFSLVYDFKWDGEEFSSDRHPEMDESHSLSLSGLNYMSAVYPLPFAPGGRNLVVSLSLQRKFDFDRRLKFRYNGLVPVGGVAALFSSLVDYRQEGQLSSLSPALGFEITEELSLGLVVNLWNEDIIPNNDWKSVSEQRVLSRILGGFATNTLSRTIERHKNFHGINYTVGALYKPDDRWSFGLVYHTRFTAGVDYEQSQEVRVGGVRGMLRTGSRHKEITFPDAVGAGAAYRFPNDKLTLSFDVTRRSWDQFVIHDRRNRNPRLRKVWGVSGQNTDAHDMDAVWTVRAGAEYVFVDARKPVQNILPSVRAGLFYDPEPASGRRDGLLGLKRGDGSPDNYYGVTLGLGVLLYDRVNLDLAYVYRWGDDNRVDTFGFSGTHADVDQHTIYLSTVIYF